MERRTTTLVCFVTLAITHYALAQNPTISLIPLVDDVRRECVGGPNDGEVCLTTADCEVGPECQRVCDPGPDSGAACVIGNDCFGSCVQSCACNRVIRASPDDIIEAEIFAANWAPNRLAAYQANIDMRLLTELMRPLGFDGPAETVFCDLETCAEDYPICDPLFHCVGPNHNPELGSFIDSSREDYVFAGIPRFLGLDVSTLIYRYGGFAIVPNSVLFTAPKYLGTMIFEVAGDVGVRFTVPFRPMDESTIIVIDPQNVGNTVSVNLEGLTIEIVEPPPPPETIPTTSTWGIVVLSLTLLAGAKVRFGRHATTL